MFERLRKIRTESGYTCSQIASKLGISKATYSKKERGLIIITVQEAQKIATFLNRSIEDIFFATKNNNTCIKTDNAPAQAKDAS